MGKTKKTKSQSPSVSLRTGHRETKNVKSEKKVKSKKMKKIKKNKEKSQILHGKSALAMHSLVIEQPVSCPQNVMVTSSFMKTFLGNKFDKNERKKQKKKAKAKSSTRIPEVAEGVHQENMQSYQSSSDHHNKKQQSLNVSESSAKCVQKANDGDNFAIGNSFIYTMFDPTAESMKPNVIQYRNFTAISVPDDHQVLILIETGLQFALRGKYYMSVLSGIAEIYGYVLTHDKGWCKVYSADNASFLTVNARELTVKTAKENRLEEVRNFMTSRNMHDKLEFLQENMSVFLVRELTDIMCNTVCSMPPFKRLLPITHPNPESILSMIGLSEADPVKDRLLQITDQFKELSKHFRHAVKESEGQGRAPSIVLCGGKNVGKSTLCRYMVNSMLSCVDRVAFLECDIGQTEVTPPGCVSLSIVTQPFLGPPFTHLQANQRAANHTAADQSAHTTDAPQPIMQYFVGHVTPSEDPSYYVTCLQQTIEYYFSNYSEIPLVVNTMGWNIGLGLMLMIDTLKMVRPSFLGQIKSRNEHRNFPGLSPAYVKSQSGWKHDLPSSSELNYKRFVLDSVIQPSEVPKEYSPSDQRDLAILAYFCNVANPRRCTVDLFSMVPYVVEWSSVGVHVIHTAVPYRYSMYALNASIVGMCTVPTELLIEPEDPRHPKRIAKMPAVPCHMFGIVRGVDPVARVFHILTPEPRSRLVNVNMLILGGVTMPRQLMIRESGMGRLPYVDVPQMVQGMPRKACLQRVRLSNRR